MNDLFGSDAFANEDVLRFLVRFAFDLVFVALIVHGVYNRMHRNREYVFTYYLFNIITFGMCLTLGKVPIELGFALGLFAVFGILRYRTEAIRIRDLTYLFIVIGLGILNGVANKKVTIAEMLVMNTLVVGATALLELRPRGRSERSVPMFYDNLELLKPGNEARLRADIHTRTGLDVVRIEVVRFDMLRDSAELLVFYMEAK